MDRSRGMPAESWLQWNIGALTAYGTLLLGMGQADPTLPVLSVFAALSSILFTDRWQWFRLPRSLGNAAAMVALIVCVFDFFQDRERQLLAIAHLLVYLQIILLYQQKSPRVYWQLIVLSLLQVVVASALNEHINFGILLIGYLFTSLTAISRLFILRESMRAAVTGTTVIGAVHPALLHNSGSSMSSYIGPLELTTRQEQAVAASASRRMLGWPWLTDLTVFSAGTLCAAFLFFFMTPRVGGDPWEADTLGSEVGFNPSDVSLDDFGQIQQSEAVVMRASFIDQETEQPIMVEDEIFFRGAVKSDYNNGRWSNSTISENKTGVEVPLGDPNQRMVRQEYTLEPSNHEFLFHAAPAHRHEASPEHSALKPHSLELLRSGKRRSETQYSLLTSGFDDRVQRDIVPQYAWFNKPKDVNSFENLLLNEEMLEFSPIQNPETQRIADEVAANLGPTATPRYSTAKALEAWFTEPGRFEYTLDPQVARIANGRDNIEVFLTEVRAGHCEYFASALALMLRSQGIPSRLVVGYYGGEYNVVGGYYVVKEKFAHAWVEAYLRPEDIPPGVLPPGTDVSHGAWLRLNPTPESIASAEIEQNFFTRLNETLDYVQMLWREYVMNLNAERQFEKIYRPLQNFTLNVRAFLSGLTDQKAWNAALAGVANRMGFDIRSSLTRTSWFYWPAGLVVIVLGIIGVVVVKLYRSVERQINPAAANERQREKPPAFYLRFERLARKHRIVREAGQTPKELAAMVSRRLAASSETTGVAETPQQIVAALYQVRFQGHSLTKQESDEVDNALAQLAAALKLANL